MKRLLGGRIKKRQGGKIITGCPIGYNFATGLATKSTISNSFLKEKLPRK